MNVLDFIDSPDIRNHLSDIDYKFSVPELAFLVYMSRKATLQKKFEAWQEIINTMSDCSMHERLNLEKIPSIHKFLKSYMKLLHKILDWFYEPQNAVYTYEILEEKLRTIFTRKCCTEYEWCESGIFFENFQSAFSGFKRECGKDSFEKVRFSKYYFFNSDEESQRKITLEMNTDLEILSVDVQGILQESDLDIFLTFEGMWFSFPTPFKRGDILLNKEISGQPVVLNDINTWDSGKLIKNGYSVDDSVVKRADSRVEKLAQRGDTSDMNYSAYYVDDDKRNGFYIYSDVFWNYLYLEYYTKPLEGEQKVLLALSNKIRPETENRIDDELFCNASQLIFMEEQCRRQREYLENLYTKDSLIKAGIILKVK